MYTKSEARAFLLGARGMLIKATKSKVPEVMKWAEFTLDSFDDSYKSTLDQCASTIRDGQAVDSGVREP